MPERMGGGSSTVDRAMCRDRMSQGTGGLAQYERTWRAPEPSARSGPPVVILPCSTSIMAATEVIGLVIEAMRNSVSGRMGVFVFDIAPADRLGLN